MPSILSGATIISLVLIITVSLTGCTTLGGVKNTDTIPLPSSSNTPATSLTREGGICAIDKTKKTKVKLTPNLSQDLSKSYTQMDSLGIASTDLLKAWQEHNKGLASQEEKINASIQAMKIGTIPGAGYTMTAMMNIPLIYACSATDKTGQASCTDMGGLLGIQTKSTVDARDHYTRELIFEGRDAGKKMVFEGKLGDPGNLIIRSDESGKQTNITTTRDARTGDETYVINSTEATYTITEKSDCSGTAEIHLTEDDGKVIDISMNWQFSLDKTTGTITSKSTEPLLNTTFSW